LLIDARTLPPDAELDCDICVIGGGPAGITLARRWIDKPVRVTLLESGGLEVKRRSQNLARGTNVGLPYIPLHVTRLRCLGGSTARWTGWCRPLDPIDFEVRDWIPDSGWPFGPEQLATYYRGAHELCELGTYRYDAEPWTGAIGPSLPVSTGPLRTRIFHHSPPTHFGVAYREQLDDARNVTVYLNATLLGLQADEGGRISSGAAAVQGGVRLTVRSRIFVLAAGGIENARIMLLSDSGRGGLGNQRGLVGRYFMEHPILFTGTFEPDPPDRDVTLYTFPPNRVETPDLRGRIVAALAPTADVLRRERIGNCAVYLMRRESHKTMPDYFTAGVASLHELGAAARRLEAPEGTLRHLKRVLAELGPAARTTARAWQVPAPAGRYALKVYLEPFPNPSSRVELSGDRDRFGQPRARVHWRLTESDRRTLRRLLEITRTEMERTGSGRVRVMGADTDDGWPPTLSGGSHHMGVTRMHADPDRGVVDPDCRVHGLSNLYVAGSSVFPTAGYANPTLTVIALALRLADHLEARIRLTPRISAAT
jgi:choline dehydrogenase-like flavoprotein